MKRFWIVLLFVLSVSVGCCSTEEKPSSYVKTPSQGSLIRRDYDDGFTHFTIFEVEGYKFAALNGKTLVQIHDEPIKEKQ